MARHRAVYKLVIEGEFPPGQAVGDQAAGAEGCADVLAGEVERSFRELGDLRDGDIVSVSLVSYGYES